MSKSKRSKHHEPSKSSAPPAPATPPAAPAEAVAAAATPSDPSAPADARPQYEFDDAQNRVINELALAIIWVRVPLLVAALLQAIIATGLAFRIPRDGAHVIGVLGHGLAAVVCVMLAGWLRRAAEAFVRITTTRGRDISYLMTALRNLSAWFDLLAFFVKLYLALLGLIAAILFFGLLTNAFRGPA